MKWFKKVDSLEHLKNIYKKLLITYHPDNNTLTDTTIIMQEINSEYDSLLNSFLYSANTKHKNFDEDNLKKVLVSVMALDANIIIELIGSWIWVSGDTYPIKKELKELAFKWSSSKKMWYYGKMILPYHVNPDIGSIREKYGSTIYKDYEWELPIKLH